VYDRAWIDRLLAEHGVAHRVVRTGQLSPAEVAAAYAAADVFAFPSQTDTQGLVLQEAALAGLPVVLVDAALHTRGALAGAGLCTEPVPDALAAGLLQVLRAPLLAAQLGVEGRQRALAHTPERYAEAMVAVYRAATERRRSSPAELAA
jgi:glycosyltransferase involved in cell wall biosynthesis